MLFIPLPFAVAVLLFVLFVVVARRDADALPNRPFLALILAAAVQSVLTGLRWGYGVHAVGYVAPVIAATVPPLAYAGVLRLVRADSRLVNVGLHAIPALIVALFVWIWRDAIDLALIAIFLGYAVAILLLMRPGADALRFAPFEGAVSAYRAILFAAGALCLSAAVDTFIYLDFEWAHGAYALAVISVGNLAALIILGVAAAAASRSRAPADVTEATEAAQKVQTAEPVETAATAATAATEEDRETLAAIHGLMNEKKLYRDVNLSLDRLARKAGITTRQISGAINRAMAKNVSQYVNEYRIAEACLLLAETDKSVTEIMFEVGFQTKSNFNREFRRVTGMTPLEWREKKAREG